MDTGRLFQRFLEDLDVPGVRAFWAEHSPQLDQPKTDAEALASLHMARTAAEAMSLRARSYSHAWLTERGHRSLLPDHLKAGAERLYPRIVSAVGISVSFPMRELKPAADAIRAAMEAAVLEAEADGRLTDAAYVTARMTEARDRERRALFGRL